MRYKQYLSLHQALRDYTSEKNLWSSGLWKDLFIECLLAVIHPNIICSGKK